MYIEEKCKEERTFRLDPKRIVKITEIRLFQKEKIISASTQRYESV